MTSLPVLAIPPSVAASSPFWLRYTPALDGLRAIAVLLVMGYHSAVPGLTGGSIGVDLFFVLSGFLITALLLQEWQAQGRIHLPHFYIRRTLRLLPALLFFLTVFLLSSLFTDRPPTWAERAAEVLATATYTINWLWALGIWEPTYLVHAWSLAIEEQFYLLWPPILTALLYNKGMRGLPLFLLGGILLSWAIELALLLSGVSYIRIYAGLDTRADFILAGCLLAAVLYRDASWQSRAFQTILKGAALIAVLVIISVCIAPSTYLYTTFFTSLLMLFLLGYIVVGEQSVVHRALAHPWLVAIGKLSYGLYLWNYVIYEALLAWGWPWYAVLPVGTLATFACATFSYIVVERPFLRRQRNYRVAPILK